MTTHHVGAMVVGDVIAVIALAFWWLGAYEAHIGVVVTSMAGIYYLFQFAMWIRKHFRDKD